MSRHLIAATNNKESFLDVVHMVTRPSLVWKRANGVRSESKSRHIIYTFASMGVVQGKEKNTFSLVIIVGSEISSLSKDLPVTCGAQQLARV